MQGKRVERVVIAGGGTAGWIAAAALVKQLGPLISVTLVESEEIGTIGVGESTIPTARSFHELLGIYEDAFMRASQATFKLGISFENWGHDGTRYFHPFGSVGRSVWMGDFQHFWLEARRQGLTNADYGDFSLEQNAALASRFTRDGKPPLAYAYHLDAGGYARFLRSLAEAAGVRRVEGKIRSVPVDAESGEIVALELESGERIEGDLFIDCTGFRALLIGETLGVKFEDWGEWIATDRALAVQTESTGPAVPYTRAIAHGEGWRWKIPLQTRVGNGLVYASDFLSEDEAVARLLGSIDGRPLFDPRPIRYRTGMRTSSWSRNCIALGLASGFVEPLESTSIHLIHVAVTRLIQLFPFAGTTAALADRYNAQSAREWQGVRDFVILHYKQSERADTAFWRRCRDMPIPDSLAERIALFRESAMAYQGGEDLFRVDSWVSVMLGQGLMPRDWHRVAELLKPGELGQALGDLRKGIAATVAATPAHDAFIARYCAAA
ncbi:tryptophan 7-halogenase [Polymorphobacter sp. PAMC 29334]|uniref:tryptophan halogenase family protein n=1 Tax=Polymorphobacter sp. PAMC 29334 TaxID=2862331 RepID=UPI001C66604A|nr:tryptophan halogenase family protein [Polymorphobacter sp. PAMC 29334]QYE35846.1 tryptophan 7-halogenase [Polymorphobacter sp. PAMC 29334]